MSQQSTDLTSRKTKIAPYKNKVCNLDVMEFLNAFAVENFFDLAIIDPPYNIGKDFGNTKDNRALGDYIDWSLKYLAKCMQLIKPAAPVYIYGYPEILSHLAVRYPTGRQRWLAWHYTNKTVPASKFWQRSYESILCIWKAKKPILDVDQIREGYTHSFLTNAAGKVRNSKQCRYSKGHSKTIYQAHEKGALPRDVIKIPALAGGSGAAERVFYCKNCNELLIGKEKNDHNNCLLITHPTQKPMKLTEKLLKASRPADILIPFAGTGSECFMARKLNINFYATDINSDYVKLANKWIKTL
ncbi:hypothetical protein COTS27_01477 [Spirochaetota bacterium]|nr:hypothetical protein COTS27_01477 [Spirochaetota bacterium]